MRPWGEPCHPCEVGSGSPPHSRNFTSSEPMWHTARWDLLTGEWSAVCCLGHVKRGNRPHEAGKNAEYRSLYR